jgi:hypothetical protein
MRSLHLNQILGFQLNLIPDLHQLLVEHLILFSTHRAHFFLSERVLVRLLFLIRLFDFYFLLVCGSIDLLYWLWFRLLPSLFFFIDALMLLLPVFLFNVAVHSLTHLIDQARAPRPHLLVAVLEELVDAQKL